MRNIKYLVATALLLLIAVSVFGQRNRIKEMERARGDGYTIYTNVQGLQTYALWDTLGDKMNGLYSIENNADTIEVTDIVLGDSTTWNLDGYDLVYINGGTYSVSGALLDFNSTGNVLVDGQNIDITAIAGATINANDIGLFAEDDVILWTNSNAVGTGDKVLFRNGSGYDLISQLSGTGQWQFTNYNTTTSFPGTAVGLLGFDVSGNITTVDSSGFVTDTDTHLWTEEEHGIYRNFAEGNVAIGSTVPEDIRLTVRGASMSEDKSVLRLENSAAGRLFEVLNNGTTLIDINTSDFLYTDADTIKAGSWATAGIDQVGVSWDGLSSGYVPYYNGVEGVLKDSPISYDGVRTSIAGGRLTINHTESTGLYFNKIGGVENLMGFYDDGVRQGTFGFNTSSELSIYNELNNDIIFSTNAIERLRIGTTSISDSEFLLTSGTEIQGGTWASVNLSQLNNDLDASDFLSGLTDNKIPVYDAASNDLEDSPLYTDGSTVYVEDHGTSSGTLWFDVNTTSGYESRISVLDEGWVFNTNSGSRDWILKLNSVERIKTTVGGGTTLTGSTLYVDHTSDIATNFDKIGGTSWNYLDFYDDGVRQGYWGWSDIDELLFNNVKNTATVFFTNNNEKLRISTTSISDADYLKTVGTTLTAGTFTFDVATGVDGSGVAYQIPYWSDANTLTSRADFTVDATLDRISINGTSPDFKFNDTTTDADDFWIHVNSNAFYVLADRDDDGSWDGTYPLSLTNATELGYIYGNLVWTIDNDGVGSGLDADLLDGVEGASYLRSDVGDIYDGAILTVHNDAGTLGSNTGALNGLQVYQPTVSTDASMTFHVGGDYAVHFGLDGTTNDLFVGGWSMGAVKYKIWHEGNDGVGSTLDADLLDGLSSLAFVPSAYLSNFSLGDANLADDYGVAFDYLNSVAINDPSGYDHALFTQSYSNLWSTQMASDWRENDWYLRTQNNGTWTAWTEIITADNIDAEIGLDNLTLNYVTKYNGTDLADSQIFDNGTNIGIGTATPSNALEVYGQLDVGTTAFAHIFNNYDDQLFLGVDATGYYLFSGNGDTSTEPINIGGRLTIAGGSISNAEYLKTVGTTLTAGSFSGVSIGGSAALLNYTDNRIIAPNEQASYKAGFGFTAWNNNNTSPYADFLHLRSYGDASGGSDNLISVLKSGFGLRQWQQTFGSATPYANFVSYLHDENLTNGKMPVYSSSLEALTDSEITSNGAALGITIANTVNTSALASITAFANGNTLVYGHANTSYDNAIGAFSSNGNPFQSYFSYHSTTINTLLRSSATTRPAWWEYIETTGDLAYYSAPAGALGSDITNEAELFRITAAGNVGIGTVPTSALHLLVGNQDGIKIESSNLPRLDFVSNSTGIDDWVLFVDDINDNFVIRDDTGGAGNVMTFEPSTGNVGVGTTVPAYPIHVVGTAYSDTKFYAPEFETTAVGTRDKIGLYGTDADYGIGMDDAMSYGGLNDWAMTFQFNSEADRGFWWGDSGHTDAQGAMSLTTDGQLTVARTLSVGRGEAITTGANAPIDVEANGASIYMRLRARAADDYGTLEFTDNAGTQLAYIGTLSNESFIINTAGTNRIEITPSGQILLKELLNAEFLHTSGAGTISAGSWATANIDQTDLVYTGLTDLYLPYYNATSGYLEDSPIKKLGVNGSLFGGEIYVSPTNTNTLNSGYDTGIDMWINYRGKADGWTEFRDFHVGNGKSTPIATFKGSTTSLGIGTTTPQDKLDVVGNIRTSNYVRFKDSSPSYVGTGNALLFSPDNLSTTAVLRGDQAVALSVAGDPDLFIDSDGDVGIGTVTSDEELTVYRDQDSGTWIKVDNPNAGATGFSGFQASSNSGEVMLISHGTGRTVARYGVTLGGYTELLSSNTSNGLIIGTNASAVPIIFGTNNLEAMRIDADGAVKVGTTVDLQSSSEEFSVLGMAAIRNNSTTIPPMYLQNQDVTAATIQPYMYLNNGANRAGLGVQADDNRFHQFGQGGFRWWTGNASFTGNDMELTTSSDLRVKNASINDSDNSGNVNYSMQKYIEAGYNPLNVLGGQPSSYVLLSNDSPYGKVELHNVYSGRYSDYIPVREGDKLYGEMWVMRETGATGTAGTMYFGIARFDKDKKPIAGNNGLEYFVASGSTPPSNSTWVKYSGTTTLPTSHTPYSGSDGGAVRYVKILILINYNVGTIPTHVSGIKMRSWNPYGDWGQVEMGTRLTITETSPDIYFNDTDASADDFFIHANSDVFYVLTDRDDNGSWDGTYPLYLTNTTETGQMYGHDIWTDGNDGTGSTLDADLLDGLDQSSFIHSDANDSFAGELTMNTRNALIAGDYGNGVYGLYSDTKYQHVWGMGTGYEMSSDGTTLGNFYGLAYTHQNNTEGQAISGLSHQLLFVENGITQTAIGRGIFTTGVIEGGNGTSTNGSLILAGRYGTNNYLNTFGGFYSTGGTVLGFAIKPQPGQVSFASSTSINVGRAALSMDNNGFTFHTGPVQVVSIDANISLNERLKITDTDISNAGFLYTSGTTLTKGDFGSVSIGGTSAYATRLNRWDNRSIAPSEFLVNSARFGFTSWANDNTSPYADYFHLRSYGDGSGGSDNLIMFKKSGIGMRIWQQTFGSATAYSSYVNVLDDGGLSDTALPVYQASTGKLINSKVFIDPSGFIDFRPANASYGMIIRESDGTGTSPYANMYVADAADDYMNIVVNNTNGGTGLVVTAAARVGVGTRTPTYKFEVNGEANSGRFTSSSNTRVEISGDGEGYMNADLLMIANDAAANYRGLGTFAFDNAGDTEWFWGRMYAGSDAFSIHRKSTTTHDNTTATAANALFLVNSSGNVGINTTSPTTLTNQTSLTINGTSYGRLDLQAGGATAGTVHGSATELSIVGAYDKDVVMQAGTLKNLIYKTSALERMRIESDGAVKINTTSDIVTGSEIFTVAGISTKHNDSNTYAPLYTKNAVTGMAPQIFFRDATSIRGSISLDNTNNDLHIGGTADIHFGNNTAGTDIKMTIEDVTGNVGIGTNPLADLHIFNSTGAEVRIASNAAPYTNTLNLYYGANHNMTLDYNAGTAVTTFKNHYVPVIGQVYGSYNFQTKGSTGTLASKFWIDGYTGNIGVGITIPSYKLDVVGAATENVLNVVQSGGTGGSTSFEVARFVGTEAATDISIIAPATGQSRIAFGDADADVGMIRYIHTDNHMGFIINTGEKMRIDSDGNMGIGTTTPVSRVMVANNNATQESMRIYGASGQVNNIFEVRNSSATILHSIANDGETYIQNVTAGSLQHGLTVETESSWTNARILDLRAVGTSRFQFSADGHARIGSGTIAQTDAELLVEGTADAEVFQSYQTTDGVTKQLNAVYSADLGGAAVVGAIEIKIPVVPLQDGMISMEVHVYEYAIDQSFVVYLHGYPYDDATGRWINTSAQIIGSGAPKHTIRFSESAGVFYIYIGEVAEVWQYPKVHITNVNVGYASRASQDWDEGWGIGLVGAFKGTIDKTHTSTFPFANANISDWGLDDNKVPFYDAASESFQNSNIYYDGLQVGIGASSPGADLYVYGVGSVIELKQASVGAATYYTMDNTVETGGKRYRFGYTGASADKGSFSIHNETDNLTPLLIESNGEVTISDGVFLARNIDTKSGISWYSDTYTAWSTYMAPVAGGMGPTGNITAPSGSIVTSWALRNFIENAGGYGWTFESGTSTTTTPSVVAEIRASDGAARFAGEVAAGGVASDRTKFNVYSVGSSYGIGMGAGYTFGALNDYAMTFQFNNDQDRGFWWGDDGHTNAQGAMALTTNGDLVVASTMTVGLGESGTSGGAYNLHVDGSFLVEDDIPILRIKDNNSAGGSSTGNVVFYDSGDVSKASISLANENIYFDATAAGSQVLFRPGGGTVNHMAVSDDQLDIFGDETIDVALIMTNQHHETASGITKIAGMGGYDATSSGYTASINFGKETTWTSTASTRDGKMSFLVSENGTLPIVMELASDGQLELSKYDGITFDDDNFTNATHAVTLDDGDGKVYKTRFESGTYTPTLAQITGSDTYHAPEAHRYTITGYVCTVNGRFLYTTDDANNSKQEYTVTLPENPATALTGNLTDKLHGHGTTMDDNQNVTPQGVSIYHVTAQGNKAVIFFEHTTGTDYVTYTFSYYLN